MTKTAQIKCINKTSRQDPWERISHIGGYGTSHWKLPLEDAIQKIERGEWEFYVNVGGVQAAVVVATSRFGNKYLKTNADSAFVNNLLSLPECP